MSNLYSVLILSPLVLGLTYFSLTRLIEQAAVWQFSRVVDLLLAFAAACALICVSMSRAVQEIYHVRQPASVLESLPLTAHELFHAALITRFAHSVVAAIVLMVAHSLLGADADVSFVVFGALLIFVVLVSLTEVFAALIWVHWSRAQRRAMLLLLSLVVLIPSAALCGSLVLLIVRPDILFYHQPGLCAAAVLWSVGLYLLSLRTHALWRANDTEFALRLEHSPRLHLPGMFDRVVSKTRPVRALLLRDLFLTLRIFSSAVYVAVGLAALWLISLAVVLSSDLLPRIGAEGGSIGNATWLAPVLGVKIFTVLATLSLVALLPVLIFHQMPLFWLERATGASGADIWTAKLWYARLVSLPAPLVAWTFGVMSGGIPFYYVVPLLAECLWVWWIVSTLVGALSYEMPDQPALALILMTTIGIGAGALVAALWPAGLAIYAFGMHALQLRGRERASSYVIGGGS